MKRLLKIMGVVLTVIVLASLFVAVPASAATLAWSGVGIPLVATNQLFEADGDPGKIAISPNGTTIFAAVNDILNVGDAVARPVVYRSLDGGYTWLPTSTALGAAAGDIVVGLEVSANYAADSTVFVATQTPAGGANTGVVYRSTNGGATFSQLGVVTLGAGEVITSMSVSPNYDGVGEIAISVADVAPATVPAAAATCVQTWGTAGILNWTGNAPAAPVDVLDIQFSPNYPIDATILAVTTTGVAGALFLRDIVGGVWDVIGAGAVAVTGTVTDFDGPTAAVGVNAQFADIALPSDYNGTTPTLRRAYVSLVGEGGYVAGGTGSNVYRIDNVTAGVALNPGVELGDIDYSGTYAAGTLMGGLVTKAAAALNVYYSTTAMTTTPVWFPATNAPTGTSIAALLPAAAGVLSVYLSGANIDIAADFATSSMVAAGTVGTDSAVAISNNAGVFWNERGLIDNAGAAIAFATTGAAPNIWTSEVEASPAFATDQTMFMTSTDGSGGANDTNVWRTKDAGAHWDRVVAANFNTAGIGVVAISQQYETNGTVYIGDTNTVNLLYSNDKGEGWAARTVAAGIGVTIADLVSTDAGTLYVADDVGGNVARSLNSAWVWSGANNVATGTAGNLRTLAIDGTTVVAGDDAGQVWRSADGGVTFARVGVAIVAGNQAYVDVKGDQIYAQMGATGDIYRWDFGTSIAWYLMDATPALGGGVTISADNTLYAEDPTAAANTQVDRSIEPLFGPAAPAPFFEWVAGLAAVAVRDTAIAAGSSNTIIVMEGTNNALWTYTDILSAGSTPPVLTGPADGEALTNTDQANYSVENVAGVTNWNLAFSNDSTFTNNVSVGNNQVPPGTAVFVDISANTGGLVNNEAPVYWMARATAPLRGPWSESRVVNAQPQIGVNAPAPAAVATNLEGRASVTPVLNWGAYKNATGYQVQVVIVHSPPSFTEANMVVDEVLGPVTSFAITDALEYDQAYAWRVRGLTAAGASDWSGAVGFLTEREPEVAPPPVTPTITIPPQPTPTYTITVPPQPTQAPTTITPSWIYAIIVVGAVLVIAVIVLIVRTRRIS